MDRSPPPFFKQGPSANARLLFFALLAITLLVVDARANALGALRQGIATILYPVQRALLYPRDWMSNATGMVSSVTELQFQNQQLRREETANAAVLLSVEQLAAENRELRKLLGARERLPLTTVMGQVLYEARDPFNRKLILDKGSQDGVLSGQPVVDADGVVGQITRVFPLSSEVTVITDRNLTIPVQLTRSGVRAIAYGGGAGGRIELRYLAANADVKIGDLVSTSGLDGLYPAGLPVGKIVEIDTKRSGNFLPALIEPIAGGNRSTLMSVVMVDKSRLPPPPPPEEPSATRKRGRQ